MKLAPLLLLVACAGVEPTDSDTPPCQGGPSPEGHSTLVIATSTVQFDAGTLSLVDLETRTVCDDVAESSRDTVLATGPDGRVVDVGRLGADRLNLFQAPDFEAPTRSFSVGQASNPQGAYWCGGAWWVPRLAETSLSAFDESGRSIASIDLADLADEDGIPEMADAVTDGRFLDLALQRLDRDSAFAPTDSGRVVRVDCENETRVAQAPTPPNPGLVAKGDERVLLGPDGLSTWDGSQVQDWLSLDATASDAAFVSGGAGVVVTRRPSGWHSLLCVDDAGQIRLMGHTEAFVTDALATDADEVWVSVREGWAADTDQPEGARIERGPAGALWSIDPDTCAITDRVETSLMPYSLAVY